MDMIFDLWGVKMSFSFGFLRIFGQDPLREMWFDVFEYVSSCESEGNLDIFITEEWVEAHGFHYGDQFEQEYGKIQKSCTNFYERTFRFHEVHP